MFSKHYASDLILTSKFLIWIATLGLRVTKGHSPEAVGVGQTWAYILAPSRPPRVLRQVTEQIRASVSISVKHVKTAHPL